MPNRERVLWPAHNIRDLEIWGDVYLGSLRNNQNPIDYPGPGNNARENEINDHDPNMNGALVKTRSYDNLFDPAILNCNGLARRSSDPNIIENSMISTLNISNENFIESNESPANSISLFTNKLTDSMLNSGIQTTAVKIDTTNDVSEQVTIDRLDGVVHDELKTRTFESDVIDGHFINEEKILEHNLNDSTLHGCLEKSTDTLIPMLTSVNLMDYPTNSIKNELIFDIAVSKTIIELFNMNEFL